MKPTARRALGAILLVSVTANLLLLSYLHAYLFNDFVWVVFPPETELGLSAVNHTLTAPARNGAGGQAATPSLEVCVGVSNISVAKELHEVHMQCTVSTQDRQARFVAQIASGQSQLDDLAPGDSALGCVAFGARVAQQLSSTEGYLDLEVVVSGIDQCGKTVEARAREVVPIGDWS